MSGDGDRRGTAIVTGASGGIGAAVCAALGHDGYQVAGFDHRPADATHLDRHHLVDVADAPAVQAAVAEVAQTLGPITALVHTAGILHTAPLVNTPLERWEAVLRTNATGVLVTSQAVAPHLIAGGGGAIVAVTSNAASVPRTTMGAYAASKAAAAVVIRTLGLELAPDGIRCNLVSPGSTETEMLRALSPQLTDTGRAAALVEGDLRQHRLGIPLGRVAQAADVAAAVRFLLSDDARHITLHDLRVDGGATLDA